LARDFPGTNGNYLSAGDAAAIDITGTYLTVCSWVYVRSFPSGAFKVFDKAGSALDDRQYLFQVTSASGGPQFHIGDSGSRDFVDSNIPISLNRWHHILGVKNGTGAGALRVFVDGIRGGAGGSSSETSNRSIQNLAYPLLMGNSQSNDNPSDGLIAHAAIWAAGLTDTEILYLARGGDPRNIRRANLRGYWPMDDYPDARDDSPIHQTTFSMVGTVGLAPFTKQLSYLSTTYVPIEVSDTYTYEETGVVYLDIQVYVTEEYPHTYLDLQPSGTEAPEYIDSATCYLDLQVLGGECFSTTSGDQFGEGEANLRWVGNAFPRWSGDDNLRWSAVVSLGDQIHC
jgi:hypothetical protein